MLDLYPRILEFQELTTAQSGPCFGVTILAVNQAFYPEILSVILSVKKIKDINSSAKKGKKTIAL